MANFDNIILEVIWCVAYSAYIYFLFSGLQTLTSSVYNYSWLNTFILNELHKRGCVDVFKNTRNCVQIIDLANEKFQEEN